MSKRAFLAGLVAMVLGCAAALKGAAEGGEQHGGGGELLWKTFNFAIVAGGLGYLIHRKGREFFRQRTASIQKEIEEAARMRAEAEEKLREVERKLSELPGEIERFRLEATRELAAEEERIRRETQAEVEKIQRLAEQEIDAASRAARQQLRRHAAELAAELAADRLRRMLDGTTDEKLIAGFLKELERRGRRGREELN